MNNQRKAVYGERLRVLKGIDLKRQVIGYGAVSYTHLRAHETVLDLLKVLKRKWKPTITILENKCLNTTR